MLLLYDNAFSPFARKVRMVLEHKGLAFEVRRDADVVFAGQVNDGATTMTVH